MVLPRPPAGIARVSLEGHYGVSNWVNVFWLLTTNYDLATGPDVLDLAHQVYTKFLLNLHNLAPNASHLTSSSVVLYQTTGELNSVYTADGPGSDMGNDLPAQTSRLINWSIAAYYRGGKPRTYLAGATYTEENGVTQFSAGTISAHNTGAAGFITGVNAITAGHITTVTLGTLSRIRAGVPRTPAVFYPYFAGGLQARICTQRRRLGHTI